MTAEMAEKLGAVLGQIFGTTGKAKILIGKDTRESGSMLEEALCKGLVNAGVAAVKLGVVPTPAVAYLVKELGADAAVMLTASHNPFEDNGMKIFGGNGFKLPDEMEAEVEGLLLAVETPSGLAGAAGSVSEFPNGGEVYAERVKESVSGVDFSGMKIVLDAGNGAGFQVGVEIFKDLGMDVISMATEPDGKNINADCGALHPGKAGRMVVEHGADLGISLDGDADRVIFTDKEGSEVSGDRTLAICAMSLLKAGKLSSNTMVATVMSNLGLDEAMRREGVSVVRTGVGDRLVLERMREEGIIFGGENSGHLIFSEYATTGDGILSALQVCKLMVESGATLNELAAIMREYPSTLLNLPVSEKPPIESLAKLQCLITQANEAFGDEGRQLIRYSGTEKKIRILVEHSDEAVVNEWIGKFKKVIEEEIG